jgi:hypothetical protein
MRKFYLLLATVCASLTGMAQQTDTIRVNVETDTIKVGGIIIVKKDGGYQGKTGTTADITISTRKTSPKQNISTNWGIFDFGFNNFNDKTNYASTEAQRFAPGSTSDWFDLRNGKSVNVNIWFFMQRINLIKHVVNLKYGLGLELYNFMYDEDIRFRTNPPLIYKDPIINYRKNKLATDYVTIPLMLNFNFTPNNSYNKSFGLSAGVSGSYLYSSRQKYVSDETGKQKTKGNLGVRDFKLAYIGELQLGPIKVYGSYATQSMFEKGLDHTPYAIGLRFSNW